MKNNIGMPLFPLLVVFTVLSGCGEDGGDTGGAAPTDKPVISVPVVSVLDFPVESAITALMTSPSSFTVFATDTAGNSYALTSSTAPGPVTTDNYISATALPTFIQTGLIKINGVTRSSVSIQTFYSTDPFTIWGSTDGDPTAAEQEYFRTESRAQLPATAKVGDIGAYYAGSKYRTFCFFTIDCSDPANYRTRTIGTERATWSIEADTASTAWLCLNITTVEISTTIEASCFRIDQFGTASAFKADITFGSTPTTLRFR